MNQLKNTKKMHVDDTTFLIGLIVLLLLYFYQNTTTYRELKLQDELQQCLEKLNRPVPDWVSFKLRKCKIERGSICADVDHGKD
jgi:hypothetical protein